MNMAQWDCFLKETDNGGYGHNNVPKIMQFFKRGAKFKHGPLQPDSAWISWEWRKCPVHRKCKSSLSVMKYHRKSSKPRDKKDHPYWTTVFQTWRIVMEENSRQARKLTKKQSRQDAPFYNNSAKFRPGPS